MKISIAVGALTFYPLATALRMARASRADGVELLLSNALLRRGPDAVQELAHSIGIPILSIHAPLRWMRNDLRRQVADARDTIAFAAALPGTPSVVLHHPAPEDADGAALQFWLASVDEERRPHMRTGLRVSVENRPENHDGSARSPLDEPMALRSIVSEWGLDVTFDIAHAASRNVGIVKGLDAVFPRLINVHVSDARPDRARRGGLLNGLLRDHHLPGDGELPLTAVFDVLDRRGYQGLVTIEPSPYSLRAWLPPHAQRRMTAAVASTHELVTSASGRVRQSRPSLG